MMHKIVHLACPAALALALSACSTDMATYNRGLTSVHQPVVSHTSYVFDVNAAGGELTVAERQRLEGWLDSIGASYGDTVAIATESGYFSKGVRNGIAAIVERRSLLLQEDNTAQAGRALEGSVRLIVRRAKAEVPGCPDWSIKDESTGMTEVSSNYGCAVNSNIAAMVANPNDLVLGQGGSSDLRTATSNKAIQVYREKIPTGSGGLIEVSAKGGN
ncbi:CpaD family pilus assembly protein [Sphingobium phenoxybenzoativorans]|uniref:CpaD family pilus assembly protein n=1 Tax=Sphingobium phenoxybenzoativorans TaxID=1592790 RepID=UPI000872A10F|nr:CpaD family pilus assembly lipoprotein [Sphingobium phenoxybenzoativorans]